MKKYLTILFLFFLFGSMAQQGLQMDFCEIDSTELEAHRQLEYTQFVNGTFGNNFLIGDMELPKFNPTQVYQQQYKIVFETLPLNNYFGAFLMGGSTGVSPFYYNGQILSDAAYKIGDKFVVGGFSYGANSVFSSPLPHQNGSYFDTYGSTMFMQYKVSKNFKIETSISVNQNRGPGF